MIGGKNLSLKEEECVSKCLVREKLGSKLLCCRSSAKFSFRLIKVCGEAAATEMEVDQTAKLLQNVAVN